MVNKLLTTTTLAFAFMLLPLNAQSADKNHHEQDSIMNDDINSIEVVQKVRKRTTAKHYKQIEQDMLDSIAAAAGVESSAASVVSFVDSDGLRSIMVQVVKNERDTTYCVWDTIKNAGGLNVSNHYVTRTIYDTVFVDPEYVAELNDEDDDDETGDVSFMPVDVGGDDDIEYPTLRSFFSNSNNKTENASVEYAIPAADIYSVWTDERVNPYNVSPRSIKDSIKIAMYDFVYPLKKPYHITSNFGWRRKRYHSGIDLKLYVGDSVVCPMDGMVRIVKNHGHNGYGKFIVIRHYNGLETVYGHLSEQLVVENQRVSAGDLIAYGGNTGHSTGSHLHWEFRYLGNPINPKDIIDFVDHKAKDDVYTITPKTFNYLRERTSARYWTVKRGDSLGRISQRTGVSIKRLCSLNGISTRTVLRVGRRVRYN